MSKEPTAEDLEEEVQGLALTGYSNPMMRSLVLRVQERDAARKFVRSLLQQELVGFGTTERVAKGLACKINIGFTYEGLQALGAPADLLQVLKDKSPAFGEGAILRAARLGDAGPSAPERWGAVFQRSNAHAWISIHADDPKSIDAAVGCLQSLPGATGLAGWAAGEGAVPEGVHMRDQGDPPEVRRVHFGLRDNITKPGILPPRLPEDPRHQPGELLLGYPNDAQADLWTAEPTPTHIAAFLRNGSFGVLRQMWQDVAGFETYLQKQSDALNDLGHVFASPQYLKAKLSGRWPNGMPVRPFATKQPAATAPLEKIDFAADLRGLGCPFGAHIRRANPRTDKLLPDRKRALFRRGIPYGPPYPAYPAEAKSIDRGLLGVFFCGRIEDQFEQLITEWLEKNPLGPPNRGWSKDPISSQHDDPKAEFHIPQLNADPIVLKGFRPFVRTRGMLYALFPSRRGLAAIASDDYWGRA
ncbi:hypothetical protein LZ009_21905 [Ramlibacter sp. XY19]|uniref:hypothetical protein n=1 Tax=Ramlibacter paludis TaxID=2908000 RepID=UPI0023D9D0B3|nr:hypothetical protein [Ramlibacter paludis]MCG2595441.1 hypothetical protein [Ramlibacter paludis]